MRVANYGINVGATRRRKLVTGEMIHNSTGQKRTKEARRRMRLARVKDLQLNGCKWPAYNKHACIFFAGYDKENNTKGMYATAPYEYLIADLGYWVDYINFEKKIIMEWDEPYHFNKDGSLRDRDISRQKEIQSKFPDFKFVRIKQADYLGK